MYPLYVLVKYPVVLSTQLARYFDSTVENVVVPRRDLTTVGEGVADKTDARMLEVFHRSAPRHALLRAFLQIAPRRRYVVAPKRNAARTGRTGDRGLEERHRGMHRYNRRACIGMHSVLRCTNVRATACALVQTCSSRPGFD